MADLQDILSAHLKISDLIKTEEAAFKKRKAALKEKQMKIENALLLHMQKTKQQMLRAENGMKVFRSSIRYVSTKDRAAFFDWVIKNGEWEFLQSSAKKDPVLKWADEHGQAPPGCVVTTETKVNIRKS